LFLERRFQMAITRIAWVIGVGMTVLVAGCLKTRQGPKPTSPDLKRYPSTLSAPIFITREWCDMDGDGTVSEADAKLVLENSPAVRDRLDRLVSLVNELAEVPYKPDWEDPGRALNWRPCPALVGWEVVKDVLKDARAKGAIIDGCTFAPGCSAGHGPVTDEDMYHDCVTGASVFQRQAVSAWVWRPDRPQGVKLVAAVVLNGAE